MTSSITIEKKERLLGSKPKVDWKLIGHTLVMALSVIGGGMAFRALAYRSLGPEQSGLLALSISIFTIASTVISLGIPVAVVKFIAARKTSEEGASYLLSGFQLMLLHSAIGFLLLNYFIPIIGQKYETLQIVSFRWEISVCAVLAAMLSFYERSFNGMLNMKAGAAISLTNNIARLSFTIIFLSLGTMNAANGLRAILFAGVLASAWGLKLIWDVRKQFPQRVKTRINDIKGLYEYGLPQFGAVILDQVSYNIGVILSAWYLSEDQVGIYSVAILMVSVLWMAPSAVQMLTYPLMSDAWGNRDRERLSQIIGFSVRICALILTPATFGLIYLREDLIRLVFGPGFLMAAEPLVVLAGGYWVNAIISRPLGASMGALERPRLDMLRVAIATSTNILCCWFLLPRMGILGAAWAQTLSLILTSAISHFLIFRLSGIAFTWSNFRIVLLILPVVMFGLYSTTGNSSSERWMTGIGISLLLLISGWTCGLTSGDRRLILERRK